MNTRDLEGFQYADMKACLVDIQYGVNVTATFRIFLPPTSDDERIYKECECIPIDTMFRYLVAIHHNLTVTEVDARVVMASSDDDTTLENYALYVTCRAFPCETYMESLRKGACLFVSSMDNIEVVHQSTFIKTMPVFKSKDEDDPITINGIFHVSATTFSELPAPLHNSRLRPYGLEININCINSDALKTSGFPPYDIYNYNNAFSIVNDAIKESYGLIFNWMIYETIDGFKPARDVRNHTTFHFIHEPDSNRKRSTNQLKLYVVIIPDALFGLKFAYMGTQEMACIPIDLVNKKVYQYYEMDWGVPYKTIDPVMRRMETMYSYLMSTPDYTLVSQCTSCSGRIIDDVMYFVFSFEPAIINWGTGIMDPTALSFNNAYQNSMCDFLICRSFEGFEIAFPVNGQNPRRGVLFYVRHPRFIEIKDLRQAFPLNGQIPIYCRVISVTDGYVVWEFIFDDIYDDDTFGMGRVDEFFSTGWFPAINEDKPHVIRGNLSKWGSLPPNIKNETAKFLYILTKYMLRFQLNEHVIMDRIGSRSHIDVLHNWMNCVGIPSGWRDYMDIAITQISNDNSSVSNPKKPGLFSRFFGKKRP